MKYGKGDIVVGVVTGIANYGIFMSFDGGYDGMVHISEISYDYIKDIHEYISVGDEIEVRVLSADNKIRRLQLTMKDVSDIKVSKKRKIIETTTGFSTLKKKLPFWVDTKLKNIKNI